jgi:hypothetical protein
LFVLFCFLPHLTLCFSLARPSIGSFSLHIYIMAIFWSLFYPLCLCLGAGEHRWASTSISMSVISDIRHRHLFFRYQRQLCRTEKRHSDIGSVPISTSEFIPISDIEEKNINLLQLQTHASWNGKQAL